MTAVESIAQDLAENLELQVRVYERILDLSRQQFAALERRDVHTVHSVLQELELVLVDRSRTDFRRGVGIDRVARELGIPSQDVTSLIVQQACTEQTAARLRSAGEALQNVMSELTAVTARCRGMLEHELAVTEMLVDGMTTDRRAIPGYVSDGSQAGAPRLRLLDAQV